MGGNSTYYFAPPADPINPLMTERSGIARRVRARQRREFDRRGFGYFVREVYDASIRATAIRGRLPRRGRDDLRTGVGARTVVPREDGTLLTYRQASRSISPRPSRPPSPPRGTGSGCWRFP